MSRYLTKAPFDDEIRAARQRGEKVRRCRWCGSFDMPPRRQTFCSDGCVIEFQIRRGIGVRDAVFDRDRGVCAKCGRDTDDLRQRLYWLLDERKRRHTTYVIRNGVVESVPAHSQQEIERFLDDLERDLFTILGGRHWEWMGWETHLSLPTLWEADHIVAVHRGGGGCGLENYRTLCLPCHREVTAMQANDRAAKNQEESRCDSPCSSSGSSS